MRHSSGFSLAKLFFLTAVGLFALHAVLSAALGTSHFLATVTSDSMKPSLERGDWVLLQKRTAYEPQETIVFAVNGNTYVHRIAVSQKEGYRTKGDANPYVDLWTIPQQDVLGSVVLKIPLLGWTSLYLAGK